MTVLILGNSCDRHAVHVKQALEQAGASVEYWDTQRFPVQVQLSWRPDQPSVGYLALPHRRLSLQEIHSVFWRNFTGVSVPPIADGDQRSIALRDAASALRSFMQACPVHWVNSWRAYQFHKEKPLQLQRAQQLGVSIPATLVSNEPTQVMEFVRQHQKTIFKPVYGGAHAQWVTEAHLDPQRLALALSLSPVTIQSYIPGTNLRSYVIGDRIYAAEIRSPALDFRQDEQAQLLPLALPDRVQGQCRAIAQALFLEWTAIDWRLTPSGDYVFLEANPSPMFLHFEQCTGFPITERLVELLLR